MPRGELYVQLAVEYADDDKLAYVSRSARLLYVDALCMAKRQANDGVITTLQVEKLMLPERSLNAKRAADELVSSGAWSWDGRRNAYVITGWLKRNKSRAQIQQVRDATAEKSLLGNHRRWHEARGERDPRCRFCTPPPDPQPDRVPDPQPDPTSESGGNPQSQSHSQSQRKDKNTSSPATPSTETDFDRFWSQYPRKVGKGQARKAWAKVTKAGADPDAIVAGAERYTRERQGEDAKFTAHPATWLHGERWDDQPYAAAAAANGTAAAWWDN